MESNQNEVRKICQNCERYGRCTKKCSRTGKYTARKNTCDDGFTPKATSGKSVA